MTAQEQARVRIADVAREAGVSPATVSRVMNDRFGGDPAIAERVRTTAARLDYVPSALARSLALGQTDVISFLVPDLQNPAFQEILAGLSRAAAADGFRVLVADTAEQAAEEPLLAAEVRRRTDAVVLCAPRMPESELRRVAERSAPVVMLNRSAPGLAVPSLKIDYEAGVLELAEHLHALGHRRIAFIEGLERSAANAQRQRALERFASAHPEVEITRIAGGTSTEAGEQAAPEIVATGATGVIAFNDLVAIGVIGALRERGVDVPGEVSVTGFDDIPLARHVLPALTTTSVPYRDLGALAWARMLPLLRGGDVGHDMQLQPRIVVRDSTGPAR